MHGIVSLLDSKYYQIVEDLWAELEREFGVKGVFATPYPHFSYQVAAHYDLDILLPRLHTIVDHYGPFQIRTSGLGIFAGTAPVLFIPVVRHSQLNELHKAIFEQTSQASNAIQSYYEPEKWMPHITIGFGDLNSDTLAHIVSYLCSRDLSWEITIDNISLIYDTGDKQVLKERFALRNTKTPIVK